MSYADVLFVKNCTDIIQYGYSDEGMQVRPKWDDGSSAHTKKILYVTDRYKLTPTSVPVMTLRRLVFKSCVDEMLWIYQRKTSDISKLKSSVWNSWDVGDGTIGKAYGYQIAQKSRHHKYEPTNKLINYDAYPSMEVRDDGWVYLDQMDAVLYDLTYNPSSRSIMTNTYNHGDLSEMGLRPCAYSMIFNVTMESGEPVLNGMLLQRSQDMLTANNWNTVQYAVLLQMIAQVVNMRPGEFVHSIADMHIYDRHIPIVEEMIQSYHNHPPFDNPEFWIDRSITDFYKFTPNDVALIKYDWYPFNHIIPVAI